MHCSHGMARAPAKLAKYQSMRDFSVTAEPSGDAAKPKAKPGLGYVIQAHAASRMHYDFRLELDGVLLSWSVPKGPSLSPKERRLAVRTEDHPLDYAGFEGIIPAGQYGGGTVIVWDRGTWELDPEHGDDPQAALAKGRLSFLLHGEKLRGRWHLVKTRSATKQESWLLFKGRDAEADDKRDIVTEAPASVATGRTLEQVAEDPGRVWHSNRADKVQTKSVTRTLAARTAHAKPASAKPASAKPAPAKPAPAKPARAKKPAPPAPAPLPADATSLLEQLPLGFKLTNLDKVLYPEPAARTRAKAASHAGITKGDLIAYLAVASEWMLPHVGSRPLTIVRCPDGLNGKARACFFQKHVLPGAPAAIGRVAVPESDGDSSTYMQVHDMPGIVALAQLGTLEIHSWGSHADHIEQPDVMVFDLDPDEGLAWDQVALAAIELRGRLRKLHLDSFVKTTGGKGLHVVVPFDRGPSWDEVKAFTMGIAEAMERDEPERFTSNMAKVKRKGKIFVDYLRNGRGATFIAPYSPRARPGAPVAVPITWDELAEGVDPQAFTTQTVPRRLAQLAADPWAELARTKQSLAKLLSKRTAK
ncbi:MAG TPA: non-homologous end-joining DNA ligase [Kofleriaceae bacterium]